MGRVSNLDSRRPGPAVYFRGFGTNAVLAAILSQRRSQLCRDGLAERYRLQCFHLRAVSQDVHDQFTVVSIGDAQFIAAVGEKLAGLMRMPALVGHPARTLAGKAQDGGLIGLAGENAVAAGEVFVEFALRNSVRRLFQFPRILL